ncbi:MAG: type II toxin-antitoxin system RelE/ParE family toxin [Nitrospira sp.]|nr:type II toxin-antitoxin system RelE/ParE family toxin [Nitrospira sp.]
MAKRSAEEELRMLPEKDLKRVASRIVDLAANPRPAGFDEVSGQDQYRISQGNYRVVYVIDDVHRVVEIVKIRHRKDAYRT